MFSKLIGRYRVQGLGLEWLLVGILMLSIGSTMNADDNVLANGPTARNPVSALSLLQRKEPLIIAHRGFSAVAPENTLPAFDRALATGATMVELDYRVTRDGVPVVIHDATLDRTTDAKTRWGRRRLKVANRTSTELAELDAGSWFGTEFADTRIPTLAEALDLIHQRGGVTLIERKTGDAAACAALLQERNLVHAVVIQAFDWEYLSAMHELLPEQVLGALGPPDIWEGRTLSRSGKVLTPEWIDRAALHGIRVVGWNRHVTAEAVAHAHEAGLMVWIYTVDDTKTARALLDLGVDGLITNNPSALRVGVDSPPDRK